MGKQCSVVDVSGGESKVQCCEEQCFIGTSNGRSMNQSKLEVVKQEIASVNTNILGINGLKWTGMGGFNSDDHYIYYCGQESLRRNRVALRVNKKSPKYSAWVQSQKGQNDLSLFPRQTIRHYGNSTLCPTTNAKEAEVEQIYEDTRSRTNTKKKKVLFI